MTNIAHTRTWISKKHYSGTWSRLAPTTALMLFLTMAPFANAAKLKVLHSFDETVDGSQPIVGLIPGVDGNFYGTASEGGANSNGTVFQITPGGTLSVIYSFCELTSCADGAQPSGALIFGSDGNLYGTTAAGGADNEGTVFELTLGGTLTVLYSFCSKADCADGSQPIAALVQGTDGNFYGTTSAGGSSPSPGYGTVFQLIPNGTMSTLNTLHSFRLTDGDYPGAPLIQATDGNFYGTTQAGGAGTVKNPKGHGTVFQITPGGVFTNLYTFCTGNGKCPLGAQPISGLMQGSNGNFYGTTATGGSYKNCAYGCGTIFEVTSGGALTSLVKFNANNGDYPVGGLVQAAGGNLYGTTAQGGAVSFGVCEYGCGTVFEVTSEGKLKTLATFDITDGDFPVATLLLADETLYGTTQAGGAGEGKPGTVFKFAPVASSPALQSAP